MVQSLGRLISILYRKNQGYLNDALAPHDLTASEQAVLMYLYKHNEISQEEIAHYLQLDKASITRTLQSLINKEFVTKKKDTLDKRCNVVSITIKGEAIKQTIVEKLQDWNQFLLEDFDEEQQQFIYDSLLEIVEKVEKHEGEKNGRK
ncbi:MarR family winged helix-turn-helix transcriptional regulator [Candidatus Enterococcus ferrettii]|uniref:HTH marR-type domain-containing protein n=1 Tax=Candidatus Enterococcus ferrettii TaxID=2815324 RepID=A0ABV0EL36_9ENTE|nr:MarR family transcriptional regulator [Enterococcus sp. 665A]MBO1340493.1 MarR family transcriptional regulator [Enterococcus sp. 665A]